MSPFEFYHTFQMPGAIWCEMLPGWKAKLRPSFPPAAHCLLMTIAGQESQWQNIQQIGGPALGCYQFETAGCAAVLNAIPANGVVHEMSRVVCLRWAIDPTPVAVHAKFLATPHLQVAFARLLLWSDYRPLPALGDVEGSWLYYVRNWGPGAVLGGGSYAIAARERWTQNYAQSLAVVTNKSVPAPHYIPDHTHHWRQG